MTQLEAVTKMSWNYIECKI